MQHAIAVSEVRRGEAALEQGRADDALASFRAALDSEPTNASAFRGMGMAYAVQGEDAQALQSYDKYLRLAPSAPDAGEIRKSIRELKQRAKMGAKAQ
jgi:regulator of sirC expression with transglutaminase-like and TPR domain